MNTSMGLNGTRRVVASLLVLLAPALPHSAQQGHPRQPPVPPADVATRDEQADAELVSRALMNPDDDAREDAVRRLPDLAPALALPTLQQALLDGRARVRSAAIDAIADIGGDAAVGMLTAALVDSLPEVREDAVYALGRVGGPLAQEALAMAVDDPDPSVRHAAVQVARELARRRPGRPASPRPGSPRNRP
jgi:HEAT repeat protein